MAHVQGSYIKLWRPQDLAVDKISSQKMFVDNINALEAFALLMLNRSSTPVASITALRAIDTSNTAIYIDGTTVMVKSHGLYFFDRGNTAVDDGDKIIAPTTGGGRWVSDRTFLGSLAFRNSLTKSDIGLSNVPNVTTNDQTPTYTQAATLTALVSGEKLSVSMGKLMKCVNDLISHLANKSNPHDVTKAQIGLGSVDNTSDISKPVSTAQATAIADAKKAGTDAQTNLTAHTVNKSNPHGVTKAQISLGNVDNTSDANKPVSTAQATAIADAKKAGTDAQTNLTAHTNDNSNPHGVTKTQVGLGNVPNVATNDQTPTYSQATTLENIDSGEKLSISMGKLMKGMADLIAHLANKSNPHGVTKTQVGLGNVPNVATNDQTPTYTQATTLATLVSGEKLSISMGKTMKGLTDLIAHIANTSNPHGVTKSQVGLGSVDNTSDTNKPVSTAQATAIASAKKAGTDAQANLTAHIGNTSNPHAVTKAQVGLGNVDNTSDLNKPISTAVQIALNGKANVINGEIPTESYMRLTGFSLLQTGDLNDIRYTGQYGIMSACTNRPSISHEYGILEVAMYSSHWLIQRYYTLGFNGTIGGIYYRAYYSGSTWTEWKLYNMGTGTAMANVLAEAEVI